MESLYERVNGGEYSVFPCSDKLCFRAKNGVFSGIFRQTGSGKTRSLFHAPFVSGVTWIFSSSDSCLLMNPSASAARGYLLALLATVLWSTVFPLVRVLPQTLSPVELAFWRWLFTFSCMLPFGAGAVREHWALVRQCRKWMVPAGVLGFAMYSILMFEAGHTTDATNLSLIAATAPVFMAFFARFFLGERLASLQLCGLAVAVFGVIVLVLHGDFHRPGRPVVYRWRFMGCCWPPHCLPCTVFLSAGVRRPCRKRRSCWPCWHTVCWRCALS